MFKEWLNVLTLLKNDESLRVKFKDELMLSTQTELTYHEAKHYAQDYQHAKLQVYKAFDEKTLGKWITKPFEQNHFTIND